MAKMEDKRLTADDARSRVRKVRARKGMPAIYAKILKYADEDKTECEFSLSEMNDVQAGILCKEDSYEVQEISIETDPPPYHRSRQTGWLVSWAKGLKS